MSLNRKLDGLIIHADGYSMTRRAAIEAIAQYANDLDLMSKGVKFKDLGISDRRKAMKPQVLSVKSGVVVDRYDLTYEAESIPQGSYAKLILSGTMRSEGGMSSRGIKDLANDIQVANANPSISGIIIEASTGGGESLSGQILKNAIKDSTKPVVVYAHYLGSAGVHGTLTADYIMAGGNTSEIGSIGTLVSINKEVAAWYSENVDDIYSDASDNKNHEWREYLKGNKGPFVELVKQDAIHFQNEVKKYRPLSGDVEHTLSGAMLSADLALERGLIDGIGTFNEAIKVLDALVAAKAASDNNTQFISNQGVMSNKLIDKLNGWFGLGLSQDASEDDAIARMEERQAKEAEKEQQAADLEARVLEAEKSSAALTEQVAAMKAEMQANIEAATTSNAALSDKIEKLATKVDERNEEAEAVAKAIADKTQGSRNSTVSKAGEELAKETGITFKADLAMNPNANKGE